MSRDTMMTLRLVVCGLCIGTLSTAKQSPHYGSAQGCTPPSLPDPEPQGVPIPPLAPGEKPNFIIIMTDDQGWDDVGLNQPHKPGQNPKFVNTPNIDKFLKRSTRFDNFYVTPMCAQSRASLMTGRAYPKTGTMLVSGGYDFINRGEATFAEVMAANGYNTAHFGKWHNGRSLGYEPWTMGFQESWHPEQYIHLDNLMQHNGVYVQTYGLMEQVLMDKVLGYLEQQKNSDKPFFMFYAPNAIHRGFMRPGVGPKWTRPSPEPYMAKYRPLAAQYNIPTSTTAVWAMMEYMDDVLGRLFDYMEQSPLKQRTYIMIMSDNGSELFRGEIASKIKRMPSGMQGYKRDVEEGGVRNFLGVQGPGIQAGVIDSTLTDVTDILPTMADLAGMPRITAWDGISLKNLLLLGNEQPAVARRGTSKANQQQLDRFVISLGPLCWDGDSVPQLDSNREIVRPQPLFDFDTGGYANKVMLEYYNMSSDTLLQGFQHCIGVRWKDYKWIGRTNKVYKFSGQSHIELPCNEVTGSEASDVAAIMQKAAREWWTNIVKEQHSFKKPTFYLGLQGWSVTNVLPDGAHDRTKGRVTLLPNGASGFREPGDKLCFGLEVDTAGTYEVVLIYTSKIQATFRVSIGTFEDIQSGSAPSIAAQLPVQSKIAGQIMGSLTLPTSNGKPTEGCLLMESSKSKGQPVFINLGVIRFTRVSDSTGSNQASVDTAAVPAGTPAAGKPPKPQKSSTVSTAQLSGTSNTGPAPMAIPAPGLDLEGEYGWLTRPPFEKAHVRLKALNSSSTRQSGGGFASGRPQHNQRQQSGEPVDGTLSRKNAYVAAVNGTSKATITAAQGVRGKRYREQHTEPGASKHHHRSTNRRMWLHRAARRYINVDSLHRYLNATPAMKQVERDAIAAAAKARAEVAKAQQRSAGGHGSKQDEWLELRLRHNWPDGQYRLESMFSPYHAEGIELCEQCLPEL